MKRKMLVIAMLLLRNCKSKSLLKKTLLVQKDAHLKHLIIYGKEKAQQVFKIRYRTHAIIIRSWLQTWILGPNFLVHKLSVISTALKNVVKNIRWRAYGNLICGNYLQNWWIDVLFLNCWTSSHWVFPYSSLQVLAL